MTGQSIRSVPIFMQILNFNFTKDMYISAQALLDFLRWPITTNYVMSFAHKWKNEFKPVKFGEGLPQQLPQKYVTGFR
jgi:hypothetical protein